MALWGGAGRVKAMDYGSVFYRGGLRSSQETEATRVLRSFDRLAGRSPCDYGTTRRQKAGRHRMVLQND